MDENLKEKWKGHEATSEEIKDHLESLTEPQESSDIDVSEESQTYETESFEDNYNSEGLLTGEKYDLPDSADAFIETGEGKIINKEDLSPFEIIKAVAKENGTEIKDPVKNCSHCHGRGFEGVDTDTKMPIPCRCLFRGRNNDGDDLYDSNKLNKRISRVQKRRMAKVLKRHFKLQRKITNQRLTVGKSYDEEIKEPSMEEINQEIITVVTKYNELKSFKKTALALNLTKTKVEKILKESKNPKEVIETSDVKEI